MWRTVLAGALLSLSLPLAATDVRQISWEALIPNDAPPPKLQMAPIHAMSELADALAEQAPAARQLEPAAPVVKALDGQRVKLPGYIVPLDVDAQNRVSEFLLVPYFGACIHVPPPPSNQIVHVTAELGVSLDDLYQPFWVEGTLRVEPISSELAEVGYQMSAEKIYVYEY